jgi:zinc/manganese transport system substrate-binding protein
MPGEGVIDEGRYLVAALAALLPWPALASAAGPVTIVAAENFYGDVAQQIGGADVKVMSILSNPDEDPHLFEASPSVGRAISGARIAVYSGIDYDPWMEKLLAAAKSADRQVIVVADLGAMNPATTRTSGTMSTRCSPSPDTGRQAGRHRSRSQGRLRETARGLSALGTADCGRDRGAARTPGRNPGDGHWASIRLYVECTGYVSAQPIVPALGDEQHRAERVGCRGLWEWPQRARVKLLIDNGQASNPVAERMLKRAKASAIPVVGVTETEPPGEKYQAWMTRELDAVDQALR